MANKIDPIRLKKENHKLSRLFWAFWVVFFTGTAVFLISLLLDNTKAIPLIGIVSAVSLFIMRSLMMAQTRITLVAMGEEDRNWMNFIIVWLAPFISYKEVRTSAVTILERYGVR